MNMIKKIVAACSVAGLVAVGCVSVAQADSYDGRYDGATQPNDQHRLQGVPSGYGPGSTHGNDIVWVTAGWTGSVGCASFNSDSKGGVMFVTPKKNSVPTAWAFGWINKTQQPPAKNDLMCMTPGPDGSLPTVDSDARLVVGHGSDGGAESGWNYIIYCLKDVTSFNPGIMTYDTKSHMAACKAPPQSTISL